MVDTERDTGARRALPIGTVTLCFTDVVGSIVSWEQASAAMGAAMAGRDVVIEGAVEENRGVVVRPRGEGDSCFAVFAPGR